MGDSLFSVIYLFDVVMQSVADQQNLRSLMDWHGLQPLYENAHGFPAIRKPWFIP
jgi:hypothetical protein